MSGLAEDLPVSRRHERLLYFATCLSVGCRSKVSIGHIVTLGVTRNGQSFIAM